jgi:transcription elongation factor Elf1
MRGREMKRPIRERRSRLVCPKCRTATSVVWKVERRRRDEWLACYACGMNLEERIGTHRA